MALAVQKLDEKIKDKLLKWSGASNWAEIKNNEEEQTLKDKGTGINT